MNKLQKQAQIDYCYAQIAVPAGPKSKAGPMVTSRYTHQNGRWARRVAIQEGRIVSGVKSVLELSRLGYHDAANAKALRLVSFN